MGSDPNGQAFGYPVGFTELYQDESFQSAASASVAYKTSGGSEGNYSVTLGTSERQAWISFAVTGHNGINVSPVSSNGSSATATFPAMTTTANNCLGIRVVITDPSAGDTTPFGAMTGWTKLDEIFFTSAAGVGVYYKAIATAGTEASGTATLNVSEQWWTASFAIAPGNVTFNDTITLAKTLAVAVTKQSNAFGSASLARSEGLTVTKQSNTQGSATLARTEGVAVTKQSNAQGSTTLARTEGLTVTKNSTAYGSLSLVRSGGLSVAGAARYQVAVSLSRSEGLSVAKQTSATALITLARSEGVTVAKQSNTQGSVGLARAEGMTFAPQADTYGDASIAIQKGIVLAASRVVSAELALGRTLAINDPVGMREFIASVSLSITRSLSASAYKQSPVGVALGRSLSIAVAKQIAAQGQITLPIALAVTVDGEQIVVTIITPDLRTYNVAPEIRSFAIDHALDIDMAPDDRSFDV
jgi:hypothetical protein